MTAWYNENDPAAAHILRHMIAEGVIAPGVVDDRPIQEVKPDDLVGYTQCHFFAGGGFWSIAARLAGWPDDEPIWTASCPCQPFSAAGKGSGTDDPRHLWPDLFRLWRAGRPAVGVGEQVAGKAGYGWFDGVRADLAREGIASRTVDFPACGVDAPHQRNRQYWVAMAQSDSGRQEGRGVFGPGEGNCPDQQRAYGQSGGSGSGKRVALVHGVGAGLEGQPRHGDGSGRPQADRPVAATDERECREGIQPDADSRGRSGRQEGPERGEIGRTAVERNLLRNGTYWSDAEWIVCHDGKARRAQSCIRFLVDGLPGRVDLWRVGGNAIVPQAAAEVIASIIDVYGLPSAWGEAA